MTCGGSSHIDPDLRNRIMDEATNASVNGTDQSVYGLIVFLVIFIFFATLTSGLLVCLTKIWCGFKGNENTTGNLSEKAREDIFHSPIFLDGSDSEDESTAQHTLSTARIRDLVNKSTTECHPEVYITPNGPVACIAGLAAGEAMALTGEADKLLPPLPPLRPPSSSLFTHCLPTNGHKHSFFVPVHDPSAVIHV